MLGMAEKKKQPDSKRQGRARNRGEVILLTVEIDPRLDEAIENWAREDRRTKKTVISMALEQFLMGKDRWPPPE